MGKLCFGAVRARLRVELPAGLDHVPLLTIENRMIKSELIARLAEENPHLTQRDIERVVTVVFERMIQALENGGRVELRGFGALSVRSRDARAGRNPRTGEPVQVRAKHVPFFKSGKELRERLNAD